MEDQILTLLKGFGERFDGIEKRLDGIDSRFNHVETQLAKRSKDRKSPLLPYAIGLSKVEMVVPFEVKETDNIVRMALICPGNTEKAPLFQLTLRQFMEFMTAYNEAVDGQKIPLNEAKFLRGKYATQLMGTWTLPELPTV